LAEVLNAAQDDLRQDKPAAALARLSAYRGEDHALRRLLLGHAHARQGDRASASQEYRTALRMDPALRQAGLGLAQLHAADSQWTRAAQLLGRHLDTDDCEADWLALYAQVAQRMGDGRLLAMLAGVGVRRFPADTRFRRLDLAACLDRRDYRAAAQTLRLLLASSPTDGQLWQHLADVSTRAGNDDDGLAAIEAALLCDPTDLARQRQFLAQLLAAGDSLSALRHGRDLLAGPLAKSAVADVDLVDLLVRAADMGQRDETLGRWLALVPTEKHTPAMRIAAARRALRQGRPAGARAALAALIDQGQADPAVFLWAAHLADNAGDHAQARGLYEQARRDTGSAGRLATLALARLLLRIDRPDHAARMLRAYLDAHPEDAVARALLALAEARTANPRPDAAAP